MSVSEYMYEFAPLLTQLPLKLALDNTDQGGLEVRFVTLEREDVFPSGDLGIQQAMQKLYDIDGKGKELIKKMDKIAAKWAPYRSIACRYLWRWKDQKN